VRSRFREPMYRPHRDRNADHATFKGQRVGHLLAQQSLKSTDSHKRKCQTRSDQRVAQSSLPIVDPNKADRRVVSLNSAQRQSELTTWTGSGLLSTAHDHLLDAVPTPASHWDRALDNARRYRRSATDFGTRSTR
jgi:hypothetical protein